MHSVLHAMPQRVCAPWMLFLSLPLSFCLALHLSIPFRLALPHPRVSILTVSVPRQSLGESERIPWPSRDHARPTHSRSRRDLWTARRGEGESVTEPRSSEESVGVRSSMLHAGDSRQREENRPWSACPGPREPLSVSLSLFLSHLPQHLSDMCLMYTIDGRPR